MHGRSGYLSDYNYGHTGSGQFNRSMTIGQVNRDKICFFVFLLQFNFDIIMLIDMIQERITLKVMIHTLSAFWQQSGLLVTVLQCL